MNIAWRKKERARNSREEEARDISLVYTIIISQVQCRFIPCLAVYTYHAGPHSVIRACWLSTYRVAVFGSG